MTQASLTDLEAFAAVARHRSYRRAAQERGVSPSLLSQTIRRLEEQLGVRLLNRTTRSVMPTPAGEELLLHLAPALANIADALERVNAFRQSPSGKLRISAPVAIAHWLIAPHIAEFSAAHPSVELELAADNTMIDIVAEGFDAGIRFGESLMQDMVAVPFGPPQRMIVVASPGYVADAGRPQTPDALVGHSMIRMRFPGGMIHSWEFEKDGRTLTIAPTGPLTVNDPMVQLRAICDGAGFGFMFEDYTRSSIEAGTLVSVLDDWTPAFPGPFIYYSSRRHVPASLRAFIDFMRPRLMAR